MADWEKTIIPLDDAHEVLSVFGIGPSSREYQRWRRDDGVESFGPLQEGLDIGVRLWDPAHRRQPALPPKLPKLMREGEF